LKYSQDTYKGTLTGRPAPWSELSTIEIERHFEASPTISDSDLELAAQPRSESAISSEGTFHIGSGVHHKDYMSKSTLKRFSKFELKHVDVVILMTVTLCY